MLVCQKRAVRVINCSDYFAGSHNLFRDSNILKIEDLHPWPAHSPDLNPLVFHFWSAAQAEVYTQKPYSIESLVNCVTRFTERFSQEVIEKISHNVLRRATLCPRKNGGRFQQLLLDFKMV